MYLWSIMIGEIIENVETQNKILLFNVSSSWPN